MSVHEVPAVLPDAGGLRPGQLDELARAEQAMAEGSPTVEQELLLMSVGSLAHRARRHRSIVVPRPGGAVKGWWRR